MLLLVGSPAFAQMTDAPEPDAVEKFEPVFDAAYAMQPRAGLYGITELMMAGFHGDYDRAVSLIDAGADVNRNDDSGSTALMWASWGGNTRLVELLIDTGADVDATAMRGGNAVGNALSGDHPDVAILLLEAGADPNALGDYSHPYLETAAQSGYLDVVDALIEKGVDLDRFGPDALTIAAGKADYAISKRLIDAGTDVNTKATRGQSSPLLRAAYAGDEALLKLLLESGADPDSGEIYNTPLRAAIGKGHLQIVRILADSGAGIGIRELTDAITTGRGDVADLLLDRVHVDTLSQDEQEQLLLLADGKGQQELVRRFLDAESAPHFDDDTVRLLFRRAGTDSCPVSLWTIGQKDAREIGALEGHCEARLFVADHTDTLFAVEADVIYVIDLADGSVTRTLAVPAEPMALRLDTLKQKLREWRSDLQYDFMTAKVGAVGFLENGEIAVGMHVLGPADETYGYLFGLIDGVWTLVSEQSCHRFDWRCRFADLNGRPLDDWPVQRTAWHPYLQRNKYFVSKATEPNPEVEYGGRIGTVRMVIDGQPLTLRYSTSEGDECADDCVYTTNLVSEIHDGEPMTLAKSIGNNSIAGHYVLTGSGYNAPRKVVDIRTGKVLFGDLEAATWVESAAGQ